MTEDRYTSAPTFETYLTEVKQNRELWLSTYRRAEIDDAIVTAAAQAGTWRLAALSEDWCGDAFNTLPYLGHLVSLLPNLELRVFGRDANPDLMDTHLTNGARAIPVVIACDPDLNEHGWWGPRPGPLQAWFEHSGRGMEAEARYREMRRWYVQDRGRTFLREIVALLTDKGSISTPTLPNLDRIA